MPLVLKKSKEQIQIQKKVDRKTQDRWVIFTQKGRTKDPKPSQRQKSKQEKGKEEENQRSIKRRTRMKRRCKGELGGRGVKGQMGSRRGDSLGPASLFVYKRAGELTDIREFISVEVGSYKSVNVKMSSWYQIPEDKTHRLCRLGT